MSRFHTLGGDMPSKKLDAHVLDVRSDPYDLRDRIYQPQLVRLPPQHPSRDFLRMALPHYAKLSVDDQGEDGACTGFGLAAVLDFLLYRERFEQAPDDDFGFGSGDDNPKISPWMLYRLARLYDEWDGEDYSGSSCRGAMKGWHKHGACAKSFWASERGVAGPELLSRIDWSKPAPVADWQIDAFERPLGAYYRIEKDRIRDLQSAVHQVGAVYASARVHHGWLLKRRRGKPIEEIDGFPIIPDSNSESGCHAFAILGYNHRGFLVQNSWGHAWGHLGFAILTYDDWVQHAVDAWVATLGAPILPRRVQTATEATGIAQRALLRGGYLLGPGESLGTVNVAGTSEIDLAVSRKSKARSSGRSPEASSPVPRIAIADPSWVEAVCVRAGNNGRPLPSLIRDASASEQYHEIVYSRPGAYFETSNKPRLLFYFHGGLNSEDESNKRVRVMAPAFAKNGIYPLFYTWRTGLRETLLNIADDALRDLDGVTGSIRDAFENIRESASERVDRYIETFCRRGGPKSLWTEMKENAAAAGTTGGALRLIAKGLHKLRSEVPGLEIHLVGHSAGSLAIGYLLQLMRSRRFENHVTTCNLWAPACTVGFFNRMYLPALECDVLESLRVDVLADEHERDDSVANIYRKSLLYLVSRAMEERHKEPILGLARAIEDADAGSDRDDMWANDVLPGSRRTSRFDPQKLPSDLRAFPTPDRRKELGFRYEVEKRREFEAQPGVFLKRRHGTFDNDPNLFNELLASIRGRRGLVRVKQLDF